MYYIHTHTLYTTVHIKRGNMCKISSMIKSRPLQFGFSEAEEEVQAYIRDQLLGDTRGGSSTGQKERPNASPTKPQATQESCGECRPDELSHKGP